jgi:sporulation protein YabP
MEQGGVFMNEQKPALPHKLTLSDRRDLTLTGVTEVLSFDEEGVVARTDLGTLEVQGSNLKLKTLSPDGGQVRVEGDIAALIYEDPRPRATGWRRLFG